MARVRWDFKGVVYRADTGPVLKPYYYKSTAAGKVAVDLTGHAGWLSFWVPHVDPHVVRAAVVEGSNGMQRYSPRGDEYTAAAVTATEVRIQSTDLTVDATAGVDRAWFTDSHPIITRRVVEKP